MRILFLKALEAGQRWITVHPNGPDSKGTPVLIQERPDGTAHVVGGAGGKLNYLHLRGVKPQSSYAETLKEKQAARREAKKEQVKRDKAAGLHEVKQAAREDIRLQARQEEHNFVRTVADALGWDKKQLQFDEEAHASLSEPARAKARELHHKDLLAKAREAVDLTRQKLVADRATRLETLGEMPLETTDPDKLSVADLDTSVQPVSSKGLGFSTDYGKRAEAAGLTEDALKQEVQEAREARLSTMTDAQRQAAIKRGETARMVRDELTALREDAKPAVDVKPADEQKAIALLKAEKKLREVHKKARLATREVDAATVEPKSYVLETGEAGDEDAKVAQEINDQLRTLKTKAFLSEVGSLGKPEEALGRHLGVGAYNAINSLALAAGGAALVDRSVVDVLGISGATQVLARRLKRDLSPEEYQKIADGMEAFHYDHYMPATEDALREARAWQDAAREVELGAAGNAYDLEEAQQLNHKRMESLGHAERILGQTLGEMEANAALVMSLRQGGSDKLEVGLGKLSMEDCIRQARAIGLQRGDYSIDTVAGNRVLAVNAAGLDRLAAPVDRAALAQVRRNLDIIEGKHDEAGWLPLGIANRPDLAMNVQPGVAPRLAEPFAPGEDLHQSLRDYIGGRAADGDTPGDILADIQSSQFFDQVGDRRDGYMAALNAVAPLKGADGKQQTAEALAPLFERYADEFVQARYGAGRAPLHRQDFEVNQTTVDALHRALAEHPEGVAAYKPIGDMTPQDQRALREFFYREVAHEDPEAGSLRHELEYLDSNEPEKEAQDMFGETTVNPDWSDWKARRDDIASKVNAASLDWGKYIESMRGHANAYAALQDLVRSKVEKTFAEQHNRLNPGQPLKIGRAAIRHNLSHLDAVDPEARESRLAEQRALVEGLRERDTTGRYATGSVLEKLDAAREQKAAFEAAQMGFFGGDEPAAEAAPKEAAKDERYTVGHVAGRKIAGMMSVVGRNFKPGQPTKLWNPQMDGKGAARQRAIKLVDANKRVALSFGVGSGKTLIGLGAFTHLHGQGKVKRGLFLVPSIVQGQFGGEALRYLEPGKYNWHIQPGASRAERIAAYKNPEHHFAVMTHQSFRDDMLHLGALHAGISEDAMRDQLAAMDPAARKSWLKGVMDKEGIDFQYLMVDEGHDLLNRAGKENSGMANVVDALSANTEHYVNASGDPIKNDPSEAFDLLAKMAPHVYTDRAAFMRRYGVDTVAAKDALRREMARYVYPSRIDPDVTADKQEHKVGLSEAQKQVLADIDKHVASARMARMEGKVDVAAMKALSPSSFAGVPEDQHEALAKNLQANLGILKETATHHALYAHPEAAGLEATAQYAAARKGKPGVIFAHSLEAVQHLKARLEKEGHRVVALTGADSSKDKEAKRLKFNPEAGEPEADILIASDAGAVGMNIQRGQWLWQYDTPMTAKTHAQRNGRIFRTGQKNNVELADHIPDHPAAYKARARLANKYALRDMLTTPLEGLDDTGLAAYLHNRQQAQQDGLF